MRLSPGFLTSMSILHYNHWERRSMGHRARNPYAFRKPIPWWRISICLYCSTCGSRWMVHYGTERTKSISKVFHSALLRANQWTVGFLASLTLGFLGSAPPTQWKKIVIISDGRMPPAQYCSRPLPMLPTSWNLKASCIWFYKEVRKTDPRTHDIEDIHHSYTTYFRVVFRCVQGIFDLLQMFTRILGIRVWWQLCGKLWVDYCLQAALQDT